MNADEICDFIEWLDKKGLTIRGFTGSTMGTQDTVLQEFRNRDDAMSNKKLTAQTNDDIDDLIGYLEDLKCRSLDTVQSLLGSAFTGMVDAVVKETRTRAGLWK